MNSFRYQWNLCTSWGYTLNLKVFIYLYFVSEYPLQKIELQLKQRDLEATQSEFEIELEKSKLEANRKVHNMYIVFIVAHTSQLYFEFKGV